MAEIIQLWGSAKHESDTVSAESLIERERHEYSKVKAKQRAQSREFNILPGTPTAAVKQGLEKIINNIAPDSLSDPEVREGLRLYARLAAQFEYFIER